MKLFKKLFLILLFLIAGTAAFAYYLYSSPGIKIEKKQFVYISPDDNADDIRDKLISECGLKFPFVFDFAAKRMNLSRWIKKGRYTVEPEMTVIDIVRLFREGKMKSVDLIIKPLGNLEKFAGKCGEKLEPDSADFYGALCDSRMLDTLGFDNATVYALILPDTYNILWHTSPDELLIKLKQEYFKFWNELRLEKCKRSGLNPIQVITLASIVSKETNKTDEMPMVAGMYINRLRKDMLLQADPTVKFALNNSGLQRIYEGHLKIESPYNTYLNKGLPPGPICIASKQSIEAVLDFAEHDYLFMCAKSDFSGYHSFAKDYRQHLINASAYRKALDERGIQ